MIAEALGIDKVAFRRKNLLRDGRPQASGTILHDAALDKVLDQLADRMNWQLPFDKGSGRIRRGRGIAIGFKGITSPTTSVAIVNLYGDGSCGLYIGTVDMGQGSDTVMAQIAAEVLNLDAREHPRHSSRHRCHPLRHGHARLALDLSHGHGRRLAAEDAKRKIEALAAELGLPPRSNIPLSELFRRKYGMQAGNIIGTGSFIPAYEKPDPKTGQSKNATPFWGVGASGAEVEIDTETGALTIAKLVNIVDIGTAINPRARARADFGRRHHAAWFYHDGAHALPTTGNSPTIRWPNTRFRPCSICRVNSSTNTSSCAQASGPFGAKGAGESSTIALSPAIGNAVADAIGIHLTDLPLTPESIFRALQSKLTLRCWAEADVAAAIRTIHFILNGAPVTAHCDARRQHRRRAVAAIRPHGRA